MTVAPYAPLPLSLQAAIWRRVMDENPRMSAEQIAEETRIRIAMKAGRG